MIKNFKITIKGYMPVMQYDSILGRDYCDVSDQYGQTEFTGTDEDLKKEIARMRAVSPGISIIGIEESEYIEPVKVEDAEERFNILRNS